MVYFSFQLEIAKRKEASYIVQYAKREQEMAELKVKTSRKLILPVHMLSSLIPSLPVSCLSH